MKTVEYNPRKSIPRMKRRSMKFSPVRSYILRENQSIICRDDYLRNRRFFLTVKYVLIKDGLIQDHFTLKLNYLPLKAIDSKHYSENNVRSLIDLK